LLTPPKQPRQRPRPQATGFPGKNLPNQGSGTIGSVGVSAECELLGECDDEASLIK